MKIVSQVWSYNNWSKMDACKHFATSKDEITSTIIKMSADNTLNTQKSIPRLWIQHPTCTHVTFMNGNTQNQ